MTLFRRLLSGRLSKASPRPARIRIEPKADVYAIGDVHGCLDLLLELEAAIVEDAAGRERPLVVILGDMVDRGPESARVLEHVLKPSAYFDRVCLLGNHEALMKGFIGRPSRFRQWIEMGGLETLISYGISQESLARGLRNDRLMRQLLESCIPEEHRSFLEGLPVLLETPRHVFVHAGLRPGVSLSAQVDDDLLWIRNDSTADYAEFSKPVIHGHTPVTEPRISPFRISIDTGAYATCILTAVRLGRDGGTALLQTQRRGSGA